MGSNLYKAKTAFIVLSSPCLWLTMRYCLHLFYLRYIYYIGSTGGERGGYQMKAVHSSAVSGRVNKGSGGWFWHLTLSGILCLQSPGRGREVCSKEQQTGRWALRALSGTHAQPRFPDRLLQGLSTAIWSGPPKALHNASLRCSHCGIHHRLF